MQTARRLDDPFPHPWLDRLRADPDQAVDALLRGVAHLPGFQRASQSDAMIALLGRLDPQSDERQAADRALCAWLQRRTQPSDEVLARPGGVRRFVDETAEGIRAAWRLEMPACTAWMRANLLDLLRWADAFATDATHDLGEAVLIAALHLQQGKEYRFLWRDQCARAAAPRLRHRLDTALGGAGRIGPDEAVAGFALWAAALPARDSLKPEVVREWQTLKAVFPRSPGYWRGRWEDLCEQRRDDHPFVHWLQKADSALRSPQRQAQTRRAPLLPSPKIREGLLQRIDTGGVSEPLWRETKQLLDQYERYAELTGESYYLVTSCTNFATHLLSRAPGHALTLIRRAQLWSASDSHAWSLRATVLDALGRPDLAEAVLWEGRRRTPNNAIFSAQLAERLYRSDRAAEAEQVLAGMLVQDSVALYTQAYLLIALDRRDEAAAQAERYRSLFGSDRCHQTLTRLLAAGAAGTAEAHRHLMDKRFEAADSGEADRRAAAPALAAEEADRDRLTRIQRVAEADVLLGLAGEDQRRRGLALVDGALKDPNDLYAHLVKALAVPEYRAALSAGRFEGSLPLLLAIGVDDWSGLSARFSEDRALVDLVRLARGAADSSVHDSLRHWIDTPARWDDGWGAYLRRRVAAHLNGADPIADLSRLEHDALTQAVNVGWLPVQDVA